ncbi:hypothetical protein CR513_56058, partial [Mucuna pruriens]
MVEIEKLKKLLKTEFEIKDLGPLKGSLARRLSSMKELKFSSLLKRVILRCYIDCPKSIKEVHESIIDTHNISKVQVVAILCKQPLPHNLNYKATLKPLIAFELSLKSLDFPTKYLSNTINKL